MKKIGAIILSRYNSSRLPGKALMEIQGKAVLEYIVERVSQVLAPSDIVIATSEEKSDDPIAAFAAKKGFNCYRGSLDNVAERFLEVATINQWDYAIRVNGDNIFADLRLLKEMIEIAQNEDYDFISNVDKRTYPKGMSVEIAKTAFYREQFPVTIGNKGYEEHVMQHLYQSENGKIKFVYNTELPEVAGFQLALDDPDDFERSKYIIEHFQGPHWEYNLAEIYKILKERHDEQSISR